MVALIELEERIRMVSNLEGIGNADMKAGVQVEVFFAEVNGVVLPQFRPPTRA
jgi:uncharacterized OB-fold protein